MSWPILIIICLFIIFASSYLYFISLSSHAGPVFKPTPKKEIRAMLKLGKVSTKDIVIDLGSGDGRVVIAAAKMGALAIGYEVDPFLVRKSKAEIKKQELSGLAEIRWRSFWDADFNQATVFVLYLFPKYLDKLQNIFESRLDHPVKVISYDYQFPRKKHIKKLGKGFLYQFG